MDNVESKNKFRDEVLDFSVLGSQIKFLFEFPNQGVKITKEGKAFVWLEKGDEIEVDYDLGRFILVALKLRIKELKSGVKNLKFPLLKNLIYLSNCHRVMLAALGFPFESVLEKNAASEIIEEFFIDNPNLPTIKINTDEIESVLEKMNLIDFPLCVNFFSRSDDEADGDKFWARHSILVVGKNKKGVYVCFHKDGLGDGNPVELTDISNIVKNEHGIYGDRLILTVASKNSVMNLFNEIKDF